MRDRYPFGQLPLLASSVRLSALHCFRFNNAMQQDSAIQSAPAFAARATLEASNAAHNAHAQQQANSHNPTEASRLATGLPPEFQRTPGYQDELQRATSPTPGRAPSASRRAASQISSESFPPVHDSQSALAHAMDSLQCSASPHMSRQDVREVHSRLTSPHNSLSPSAHIGAPVQNLQQAHQVQPTPVHPRGVATGSASTNVGQQIPEVSTPIVADGPQQQGADRSTTQLPTNTFQTPVNRRSELRPHSDGEREPHSTVTRPRPPRTFRAAYLDQSGPYPTSNAPQRELQIPTPASWTEPNAVQSTARGRTAARRTATNISAGAPTNWDAGLTQVATVQTQHYDMSPRGDFPPSGQRTGLKHYQ